MLEEQLRKLSQAEVRTAEANVDPNAENYVQSQVAATGTGQVF
jgi:hypothetical protein